MKRVTKIVKWNIKNSLGGNTMKKLLLAATVLAMAVPVMANKPGKPGGVKPGTGRAKPKAVKKGERKGSLDSQTAARGKVETSNLSEGAQKSLEGLRGEQYELSGASKTVLEEMAKSDAKERQILEEKLKEFDSALRDIREGKSENKDLQIDAVHATKEFANSIAIQILAPKTTEATKKRLRVQFVTATAQAGGIAKTDNVGILENYKFYGEKGKENFENSELTADKALDKTLDQYQVKSGRAKDEKEAAKKRKSFEEEMKEACKLA